jgi:hypothetical protein
VTAKTDPRIQALRDLVTNLREYPADQSEEVLVAATQLGAELKGLADTERLTRACAQMDDVPDGVHLVDVCPSAFAGAPSVRTYSNGSQVCGPYA